MDQDIKKQESNFILPSCFFHFKKYNKLFEMMIFNLGSEFKLFS